ncbi:hypothetical protein PBY51_007973 [Eleginops maclovinus]|uniref:Uncharacterized protein n=1 Tax=Eleginops maclovinus TaxID=56733 RepID=A0AAN7X977_ELEMC|nr:hypothetical protein PBY51_007973 [Eleginops maclovinus]
MGRKGNLELEPDRHGVLALEGLPSACNPAPAGRPSSLTGWQCRLLPSPLAYLCLSSVFQHQHSLFSHATSFLSILYSL